MAIVKKYAKELYAKEVVMKAAYMFIVVQLSRQKSKTFIMN